VPRVSACRSSRNTCDGRVTCTRTASAPHTAVEVGRTVSRNCGLLL
jgi:hypothetical protein